MRLVLVLCILMMFSGNAQNFEISGIITAEGETLPFAHVRIQNSEIHTVSNSGGEFLLKDIPGGDIIVLIDAVGYKILKKEVSLTSNTHLTLELFPHIPSAQLEEVVIIDNASGLNKNTPYNVVFIPMGRIENNGNPNGLMGVLREVPGIYGAELGNGIVKPIIRGLGFSRVVTIYQGNKLENHQWGADHGLGINDLGIKYVEVIKGPASVLYGSGALGGVILARDDDYYRYATKLSGNIATTYNSVSQGYRTTGSIGQSFDNDLFFAADLAYENHADYKDGENRIIGNSRFNTHTLRLHTGIIKTNFQNKLSFTYNNQNLGIISEEEMIERSSLATTRGDREMQLPFQKVNDLLISYNQTSQHRTFETSLHLSHHRNERKEIEDDIHSIDLGLLQDHTFYNARASFTTGSFNHSLGVQGSILTTQNLREAQEILIPDARGYENGLYYLGSIMLHKWYLQGALRYDHRRITAKANSPALLDYGFILPGDPTSRELTRNFKGFTGSLGATRRINDNNIFKTNISTGYRAPDLAELFSNGPHPGTNRFETGDDTFKREQSIQADINYSYSSKRFNFSISAFGSLIENYIYFAYSGKTRLQDDLEIWSYMQTNAILHGLEAEVSHHWLRENRLTATLSAALVRARDKGSNENLTFIPPDNYSAEVGWRGLKNKSLYMFSRLRYVETQNLPGFNEEITPGYNLLNVGITKIFSAGNKTIESGITIHNAFNAKYVDHMSLLRAFNIPGAGRNLIVNLRYNY